MTNSVTSSSYRARWVFPIDRPPLSHGVVTEVNGRITSVGTKAEGEVVDLGNVALLPALINAHTHLEFSLFERPLGTPGNSFSQWLRDVVTWRREQPTVQGQMEMALELGLNETSADGSVVIGEIATPLFSDLWSGRQQSPHVVFMELLTLNPERVPSLAALADKFTLGTNADERRGLSPHAPYSVHPELLARAVGLSADRKFPLTMHVAESREELELLANHTGPLVELLQSLAAWYPQSLPLGLKPLDYLRTLARSHRAVIAHGNFLSTEEIAFAAQHSETLSVVYCPRTQAYFDHGPYPLAEMLRAGVRMAVGTDSRASNPDLSVWNELRFVCEQHPSVSPADVLKMGTLSAAEALGVHDQYGSITPGKQAEFAVRELPDECATPYEALFTGNPRPGAPGAELG